MDALIGHSGFVGSNLKQQRGFDALFRSTDIAGIEGRSFDTVVCAGVSAVKWWANQNADEDRRRIEGLMAHLEQVAATRFVLISTVDVYGDPVGVDEDDAPALDGLHPYGLNRAMLERFVAARFPVHHVIRLPALFGPGLKKNAIYDLMHDNRLAAIPLAGRFQWYPLHRLWRDIEQTTTAGLSLVNLAVEPVSMAVIRDRFFPGKPIGAEAPGTPLYDMHTRHAAAFGGAGPYVMDAAAVLEDIGRFVQAEAA